MDNKNTYYMVGIERNKDPELTPKQRNTSYFVILDDRKHGRSGKFPVFYDVDTGDYLEPPEGFLESPHNTLREWYMEHPEDDPTKVDDVSVVHKRPPGSNFIPLSQENLEGLTEEHYEITEDQIPPGEMVSSDDSDTPPTELVEVVVTTPEPVVEAPVEAPVEPKPEMVANVPVTAPEQTEPPEPVFEESSYGDEWDSEPPF